MNISQMPGLRFPQMPARMAGQAMERLPGAAVLGSLGAVAANYLGHSDTDRLAQRYGGEVEGPLGEGNEAFRAVYSQLNSMPMTGPERVAMIQTLAGGVDSLPGDLVEEIKGSETAIGMVSLAQRIRDQNPAAAVALARVSMQEAHLDLQGRESGLERGGVREAYLGGAGVSPVPAMVGGAAAGLLGAAIPVNRNAFQVARPRA
jgi:hypothetical protein